MIAGAVEVVFAFAVIEAVLSDVDPVGWTEVRMWFIRHCSLVQCRRCCWLIAAFSKKTSANKIVGTSAVVAGFGVDAEGIVAAEKVAVAFVDVDTDAVGVEFETGPAVAVETALNVIAECIWSA